MQTAAEYISILNHDINTSRRHYVISLYKRLLVIIDGNETKKNNDANFTVQRFLNKKDAYRFHDKAIKKVNAYLPMPASEDMVVVVMPPLFVESLFSGVFGVSDDLILVVNEIGPIMPVVVVRDNSRPHVLDDLYSLYNVDGLADTEESLFAMLAL